MLTTCALGIEIAEARDHTSICAAGYLDGGESFFLVDLVAYVDGTDPVSEVLRLRRERIVTAVALDPHSPAATAVKPLQAARVDLTELSTHDLSVAHGEFLDAVASGRLRHTGHSLLTSAIRHVQQRRLGGATAWERRNSAIDVSPATGVEIALWALRHAVKPRPRSKVW